MEKTMVRQAVPLQPMEDDGEQRSHLQPMEDPMPEQVEAPEGGRDPMGDPCWSKLLAGPVERGAQAGAGLLAGLVTPWESHAGAVGEEL
ncbi:AN1-type zinc finger protein 5-like [Grus japonensis]|uniref:AN1-type zinc finger protein 5-like n=1 Tax=Grus japonensis TaxID=30415 RepID=A0ABC9VXW3_GRUJA